MAPGLLDRLRQQQEELKASGGQLPKTKKPEKPIESEEARAARLAKAEARERAKVTKHQAKGQGSDDNIGGIAWDIPIEFVPNAKPVESVSGKRYHQYCVAKTLREARSLGASKADLRWDFGKNYIIVLSPAEGSNNESKNVDAEVERLPDDAGSDENKSGLQATSSVHECEIEKENRTPPQKRRAGEPRENASSQKHPKVDERANQTSAEAFSESKVSSGLAEVAADLNAEIPDERILAALPPDAPEDHVAHIRCKWRCTDKDNGGITLFKYKGINFQTTIKASTSRYASERIARACYMKFEEGQSKDAILRYREEIYMRIQEALGNQYVCTTPALRELQLPGAKRQKLEQKPPGEYHTTDVDIAEGTNANAKSPMETDKSRTTTVTKALGSKEAEGSNVEKATNVDGEADQLAESTVSNENEEAKSARMAKTEERERARAAKLQAQGKDPEDGIGDIAWDAPIEFVPNAKPAESVSGKRYHRYWTAKTLKEALSLGARRADLHWDLKKNYFRALLPASDADANQVADNSCDAQTDVSKKEVDACHTPPEDTSSSSETSSENKKDEHARFTSAGDKDNVERSREDENASDAVPTKKTDKSEEKSADKDKEDGIMTPADKNGKSETSRNNVEDASRVPPTTNLQTPGGLQTTFINAESESEAHTRTPPQKRKPQDSIENKSSQKCRKVDEVSEDSEGAAAASETQTAQNLERVSCSTPDVEDSETLETCSRDGCAECSPSKKTEASSPYAKAKTFQEALDLGATMSDITEGGFLSIVTTDLGDCD